MLKKLLIAALALTPVLICAQTSKDLIIKSAEGVELSGTLTLPKNNGYATCVILISGSGPQDRNEELLGHRPFERIAMYLQERGIACFRYDDRGVGKSTGNFSIATSEDFAIDAAAVFKKMKETSGINPAKIGFAGHSEGGMVAAMAAARSNGCAFVISLAGTGVSGAEVLSQQNYDITLKMKLGAEEAAKQQSNNEILSRTVIQNSDSLVALERLNIVFDSLYLSQKELIPNYDEYKKANIDFLNSRWMHFFLSHDPKEDWMMVKCPVLILNGSEDIQVNARQNMPAIANALEAGGNSNYELTMLNRQNHLFQNCSACTLAEYELLPEDFSEEALIEIATWIERKVK